MARPVSAKTHRRWFTVVGVYTDNWQKFCDHVFAVDERHAEEMTRNNPQIDDDLVVVAVFEGKLRAMDRPELAATRYEQPVPSLAMCWLHDTITRCTKN